MPDAEAYSGNNWCNALLLDKSICCDSNKDEREFELLDLSNSLLAPRKKLSQLALVDGLGLAQN